MTARIRVAVVVPGFVATPDEPGMASVLDLLNRLSATADVRVVALRHPRVSIPYRVGGVVVTPLGLGGARGAAGRARVLGVGIRAVLALHRKRSVHVVHGLWLDEAGAVATLAGRLLRRPSVASLMGGELVALPEIGYGAALGRGGRWSAGVSLRWADLVTVPATTGADAVAARGRRHGVARLPLGVDTDAFRPPERDEDRARSDLLFVGALEPVKDPSLALRVVAALLPSHPDVGLTVAGDGRLRDALRGQAAALGVSDRVTWLGHVARTELANLYRKAAVLLVPSRHEGQSMVAVEAAASGLPIVGTTVGVLPDLGAAAVTVPVGDESGLTAAVDAVLSEHGRRRAMAAAGRSAAQAGYAIGDTVETLLDAYRRLSRPSRR